LELRSNGEIHVGSGELVLLSLAYVAAKRDLKLRHVFREIPRRYPPPSQILLWNGSP